MEDKITRFRGYLEELLRFHRQYLETKDTRVVLNYHEGFLDAVLSIRTIFEHIFGGEKHEQQL